MGFVFLVIKWLKCLFFTSEQENVAFKKNLAGCWRKIYYSDLRWSLLRIYIWIYIRLISKNIQPLAQIIIQSHFENFSFEFKSY